MHKFRAGQNRSDSFLSEEGIFLEYGSCYVWPNCINLFDSWHTSGKSGEQTSCLPCMIRSLSHAHAVAMLSETFVRERWNLMEDYRMNLGGNEIKLSKFCIIFWRIFQVQGEVVPWIDWIWVDFVIFLYHSNLIPTSRFWA